MADRIQYSVRGDGFRATMAHQINGQKRYIQTVPGSRTTFSVAMETAKATHEPSAADRIPISWGVRGRTLKIGSTNQAAPQSHKQRPGIPKQTKNCKYSECADPIPAKNVSP